MAFSLRSAIFWMALAASSAASAQVQHSSGFGGLWTGWSGANRESLRIEVHGLQQVRDDFAGADRQRRAQLQNEGRALGERVGEIVRAGDCEEGERVARAAGDFALVEAVRSYCRSLAAPVEPPRDSTPQ